MSASSSGAVKAFLETQNLGISVYRDEAPSNLDRSVTNAYLTVSEAVAIAPDKLEDGAASTVKEHVTVDVWMQWKDPVSRKLTESYTLPGAVAKALHGSRLLQSGPNVPATTTYAVLVRNVGPRLVEVDENVVHVPIWVEIYRAL